MTAAYVVNPGGTVHSVEDYRVGALLREGFRLATDAEATAWWEAQGFHAPVEDPFEPAGDAPKSKR